MGLVLSTGIGITLVFGTWYWFKVDWYMFVCVELSGTWFRYYDGIGVLGIDITKVSAYGIGLEITMVEGSMVLAYPSYLPMVLTWRLPWYMYMWYWHNHGIYLWYWLGDYHGTNVCGIEITMVFSYGFHLENCSGYFGLYLSEKTMLRFFLDWWNECMEGVRAWVVATMFCLAYCIYVVVFK